MPVKSVRITYAPVHTFLPVSVLFQVSFVWLWLLLKLPCACCPTVRRTHRVPFRVGYEEVWCWRGFTAQRILVRAIHCHATVMLHHSEKIPVVTTLPVKTSKFRAVKLSRVGMHYCKTEFFVHVCQIGWGNLNITTVKQ